MEFEVEVASDEFIAKLIKNLYREYERLSSFTEKDRNRKVEIIDQVAKLRESQRPIINVHNGPRSIF